MRKQLRLIYRMNCILAFEFDHNSPVNYKIGSKSACQLHGVVDQWHRLLTFNPQTTLFQLMRETSFIGRFKQAGPKPAVNLDCGSYNLRRDVDVLHIDRVSPSQIAVNFCDLRESFANFAVKLFLSTLF